MREPVTVTSWSSLVAGPRGSAAIGGSREAGGNGCRRPQPGSANGNCAQLVRLWRWKCWSLSPPVNSCKVGSADGPGNPRARFDSPPVRVIRCVWPGLSTLPNTPGSGPMLPRVRQSNLTPAELRNARCGSADLCLLPKYFAARIERVYHRLKAYFGLRQEWQQLGQRFLRVRFLEVVSAGHGRAGDLRAAFLPDAQHVVHASHGAIAWPTAHAGGR